MKRLILFTILIIFLSENANSQSVGISGSAFTPNTNALLEMKSDTLGVIFPRLSNADRAYITPSLGLPEQGLTIYNKDTDLYNYWDGVNWVVMSAFTGSFVENQNAYQQIADFNIGGDGIMTKLGVGTGLAPLGAQSHFHDGDPTGGNTMLLVEDNPGNPIMSIIDYGHIGFGTAVPNNNAIIDVNSNQGVLLPRMTNPIMNAYGSGSLSPTEAGMIVYDSTNHVYNSWDGYNWNPVGVMSGSYIENQNAALQPADYRIAGLGVASKMGVGTGMGAILGSHHIHDANIGAGDKLLYVDDYIGLPILTALDQGRVGIGTSTPNPHAKLEVADTLGVLLPRLNTGQMTALAGGLGGTDVGMTVFNSSLVRYEFWDGIQWVPMLSGLPGNFILNQNTAVQPSNFNVSGAGVTNKLGVGTGLGPVIGLAHLMDNSPTAGSRLFTIDDFVGLPLMSVNDAGQVGLGTTAPVGSALIDMNVNNRGFLPPRMTDIQRAAIVGPVQGLIVYQTNAPEGLWFHDGVAWHPVDAAYNPNSIEDLDGDTKIELEQSPDDDIIHFTNQGVEYFDFDAGRFNINNTGGSVFIGEDAGVNDDLSANRNIEIGHQAGTSNTTGNYNVDIGYQAGNARTTGNTNTHIGYRSGAYNTGSFSTSLGGYSLELNTTGEYNTALGGSTLRSNTTGEKNVAVGYESLKSSTTATNNTAVGARALTTTTTGSENSALGHNALYYNTTGENNTSIGHNSMYTNTTGWDNTAVGHDALNANSTGYSNTTIGKNAMELNTTGFANTAIGKDAMSTATSANYNTSMGVNSLPNLTTGNANTGIGYTSLYMSTSGYENTALGHGAGHLITTGNNNTCIGKSANVTGTVYNSSAFGNGAYVTASNSIELGDASVTSIGGFANWTNLSDGRCKQNIAANVPGLEFINKLAPVTYNMNLDALAKIKGTPDSLRSFKEERAKEQITYTGLIAQDVEKAASEVNYNFSGVDTPQNENDHYALRYAEFVAPLIKAVQELHDMNRDLKMEVEVLRKQVANDQITVSK